MRDTLGPGIDAITEKIIGAAFEVSRVLGHGFLEAVYQNALREEIESLGLRVEAEKQFPVRYKTRTVGTYYADLFVEETVIVELKTAEALCQDHVARRIAAQFRHPEGPDSEGPAVIPSAILRAHPCSSAFLDGCGP